jgi:hypothetical protein
LAGLRGFTKHRKPSFRQMKPNVSNWAVNTKISSATMAEWLVLLGKGVLFCVPRDDTLSGKTKPNLFHIV